MRKTDQLYITRFLIAMSVVIFHYGRNAFPFDIYPINVLAGTAPISYFFVLSGFVMMLVYYNPGEKFDTPRFWFNRFARVYPVYLLSLVWVLALAPNLLRDHIGTFLHVTLLQGWVSPYPSTFNFPAWALSVEAFLYLIFPLLILAAYKIPFKVLVTFVSLFWVANQVAHTYLLNTIYTGAPSLTHDLLFYNPLVHVNSFLVGCTGGIWFARNTKPVNPLRNLVWLGISAILIALALLYFKELPGLFGLGFKVSIRNGSLSPLYLMLILSLASDTTRLSKFLSQRWIVLLGEISYCVYLFQFPVHTLYKSLIEPHFLNHSNSWHFTMYSILLTLVSFVVFRLFEEPVRFGLRKVFKSSPA